MGWTNNDTDSWTMGEIGRIDGFVDSFVTSLLFLVFGAIAQMLSNIMNTSLLATTLPIFNLVLGFVGIIAVFTVSENGILYIAGWTLASVLLALFGLIGALELIIDLMPVGIIILSKLIDSEILSNMGISNIVEDGDYF
jgi:hypothetical protein